MAIILCSIKLSFCHFKGQTQGSDDWQDGKTCKPEGWIKGAYQRPTPSAGTLTEFKLLCKTACDQQSDCSVAYVNWVDEAKKCDLYKDHCKTNTVGAVTGHYIYVKGNYQNLNYKYS